MIGCKDCQKTVQDYSAGEIADDEICISCDTPLGAVKAEQDNEVNRGAWFGNLLDKALKKSEA